MNMDTLYAQMIALIGNDATHRFIARFGGQRIYIPQEADAGHPIARAIGAENYRALIAYFGCGQIDVPNARLAAIKDVHRDIRAKRKSGVSANDIAAEYGITWRHVYRIIAADVAPENMTMEIDL